jgi:hypothetical protein
MGGGPKASAANLEPLGKRRRFGVPADTSNTKSCASLVYDVKSASEVAPDFSGAVDSRSAPLSGTARTATSHIESEVIEDPTSTLFKRPDFNSLPRREPASLTTEAAGYVAVNKQTKSSAAAQTTTPVSRAPSLRTRLETSARALALAQEWQAKFKALSKKPPVLDSPHETEQREQPVRVPGEQSKSGRYDSQTLPVEKSESEFHGVIATDQLEEEPSSERGRKNGPGPQASAANLEPLGKSRRGVSPQASVDDVSISKGVQQQSSLATAADESATVVQNLQLVAAPKAICSSTSMQNVPSLGTMAAPASDDQVLGKKTSALADRDTMIASKRLMSGAVHGRWDADNRSNYPSPPRNGDTRLFTSAGKSGNNVRSEDTVRKRKRSPAPYRRRDYYNEVGHREDRIHNRNGFRNDLRARDRSPANFRKEWNLAYHHEARPSRTTGVRDDRILQSERVREPASYQSERQYTTGYSYNDRHVQSRMRDIDRPSHKGSHSYRRDRSASPRRPYHNRQDSRDHNRHRSDEFRHRGDNDTQRGSRAEHKGREYSHHDPRYSYDEVSRPSGRDRRESDRRQQSQSPDPFIPSGERSDYRGHGVNREPGKHRDNQYTRNLYRH